MFVLKKKTLLIALLSVVLIAAFAGGGAAYAMASKNGSTIVIDAGHGGADGGVTGVETNVKESDLNLTIAKALADKLRLSGYNVVETRTTKDSLAERKKDDMKKRKEIIDGAAPDTVISIHMNKFKDRSRRGAQVFYDDTKKWEVYGKIMQGALNEFINAKYVGRTDFEALGGDYFLTKCHDCPSLIIECGFLSNAEDERLLTTPSYQNELIDVIIKGVEAFREARGKA